MPTSDRFLPEGRSGPDHNRPGVAEVGRAPALRAAALTATHGAKASTPPRPIPRAPATHCTRATGNPSHWAVTKVCRIREGQQKKILAQRKKSPPPRHRYCGDAQPKMTGSNPATGGRRDPIPIHEFPWFLSHSEDGTNPYHGRVRRAVGTRAAEPQQAHPLRQIEMQSPIIIQFKTRSGIATRCKSRGRLSVANTQMVF